MRFPSYAKEMLRCNKNLGMAGMQATNRVRPIASNAVNYSFRVNRTEAKPRYVQSGGDQMSIRTAIKSAALALASGSSGAALAAGLFTLFGRPEVGLVEVAGISSLVCTFVATIFLFPLVRKTHLLDASTNELYRLSRTDYLTGLPNRRDFYERAAACFQARRDADPISVFVIDIDHFKALNDRHGHAVGDQVLAKVAQAISRKVAEAADPEAVIGRVGGEEFAVLAPRCPVDRASQLACIICSAVASEVIRVDGTLHMVTVSVGVDPETEARTIDASLLNADEAAYAAKAAGRNRWTIWTRELQQPDEPKLNAAA